MLRLRVSLMEKHGDMVSIVELNHQLPRYVHTLIFWYFYLFYLPADVYMAPMEIVGAMLVYVEVLKKIQKQCVCF